MIGDRIRQARLAAGLTLEEVTERLAAAGQPITKQGLSKYEHNKSIPKAALLLKLAGVLGVKAAYLLREPEIDVEWVAFRRNATLGVQRQAQIQAAASAVAEGQYWLQSSLYPTESPTLPAPRPVTTPEDAEAAAEVLREAWKLCDAPIESVTQATEDHGGIVVGWAKDTEGFDGLSGWLNGRVPLAVINLGVPDDRRRFNLAHELGHMVMRCEGVDYKQEERLAHRFASAFLVPAATARHELGERRRHLRFDELGLLKQKYGLSMQAWARRARDLNIIEQSIYSGLCKEFSSRGWRKHEPYAFTGQEEPARLRQMTLRALAEGIITEERAEELCPGCVQPAPATRPTERRYTARELMRMPAAERSRILAAAAAKAEADYRDNPELTAFEAFGKDDFYDEYPNSGRDLDG